MRWRICNCRTVQRLEDEGVCAYRMDTLAGTYALVDLEALTPAQAGWYGGWKMSHVEEQRVEVGLEINSNGEWAAVFWAYGFEGQRDDEQGLKSMSQWFDTREEAADKLATVCDHLRSIGAKVVATGNA